jgi:YGGT family protein
MRSDIIESEGPSFRRHRIRGLPTRVEVVSRIAQVLDYLFGILYALLAVRFVLEVLRARRDAGFVEFIRDLTNFFYAPFNGIVPTDTVDGVRVVWPLVVAVVAYGLLHALVRRLLRLLARA